MKISGNKILITGGGSGIGWALAERFHHEGNEVLICGRRKDALEGAAAKLPGVRFFVCDVAQSSGRQQLLEWVRAVEPGVNVLVNNAGIQQWVHPADPDFASRAEVEVATNALAPILLTSLFLELGTLHTVMNVTSGLSFVPLTKVPVYSATKAFLHSYTLSLRALLKPRGIEVVEIIPPALNTDLGGKGLHDHAPPVSAFIEGIFPQLAAGKTEVTFGFSEHMVKAGPDELKAAFVRMNGPAS